MQLFDSAKIYLFIFGVLALIAMEKLRQLTGGKVHPGTAGLSISTILLVLITLFMAAYLPVLLGKISNRIEQLGIVLTEVLCVLWLAELLAGLGVGWASVPYDLLISALLYCAVAILAGVRVIQVLRRGNPAQKE
jgi:hypothetical protein